MQDTWYAVFRSRRFDPNRAFLSCTKWNQKKELILLCTENSIPHVLRSRISPLAISDVVRNLYSFILYFVVVLPYNWHVVNCWLNFAIFVVKMLFVRNANFVLEFLS